MTNSQNEQIPAGNLIPVFTAEIGGISTLAANARDLYQFLGVKRDFSTWIKKRLTENKFVEGEDFRLPQMGEPKNQGMQPRLDYILELNTAKELAMQEKNDKGRMVRKYFIECERKIHETSQTTTQNTSQPRDKGEYIFGKAVLRRVWFWTLEKRDIIVHPGMDRHALFSITLDIRAAHINELIDDTVRFFPTSPQGDPELIKFINEWVPSFFRETASVA